MCEKVLSNNLHFKIYFSSYLTCYNRLNPKSTWYFETIGRFKEAVACSKHPWPFQNLRQVLKQLQNYLTYFSQPVLLSQ